MSAPRHQAEAVRHQPLCAQAGAAGAQIQRPDDEIDLVARHPFDQRIQQAFDQFDLHVRRALVQRGDGARQQHWRGRQDGADMQAAGDAGLDRLDLLARARGVALHAAGIAPQRAPRFGQRQRPAAREQRRAHHVFHIAQPVRQRGLRHVHGLGRGRDGSGLFQGDQHFQVAQLQAPRPEQFGEGGNHAEMVMDISGLFIGRLWASCPKWAPPESPQMAP